MPAEKKTRHQVVILQVACARSRHIPDDVATRALGSVPQCYTDPNSIAANVTPTYSTILLLFWDNFQHVVVQPSRRCRRREKKVVS